MNYLVKSDSKLMPKDLELYITQKLTGKWDVSEFTGSPITEGMMEEALKLFKAQCVYEYDYGCSTCKYKQFNDCEARLTLDILSQMQPPANPNSKGPAVELPMVKTGVLELPLSDDDDFQYELITRSKTPQYEIVKSFKNGDKIDITEYPELRKYCNPKSIQSSVDYSKIPVGSIVKVFNGCLTPAGWVVKNDGKSIMVGLHKKYDPSYCLGVNYSDIKSIEIIRWGGK
jgi:hypothetical protein